MPKPKVSVIMPAYNSASFIKFSIDSILRQTLEDLELIVVDDGSTDNTFEAASAVADPRIKVVRKENGGAASARNSGLLNSSGEYIAYCDADDRFVPGHVKLLADHLDQHPEIGMVYSRAIKVDVDGQERGGWGFPFERRKMEYFCLMVPSIAMHRRECLEKAGYWDEDPALRNVHEDWDFFMRICDHYEVAFLDIPSVLWLKLPEGLFIKALKSQGYFIGLEYILKKRLQHYAAIKKTGVIAPIDGYYFYNFQTCTTAAEVGEQTGAFIAKEIYNTRVIPLFSGLVVLDPQNLEIWLVLGLLYYMQGQFDRTVEMARKAEPLLGQKIEVETEIARWVVISLKGMSSELSRAGEKTLAERFLAKTKEFI